MVRFRNIVLLLAFIVAGYFSFTFAKQKYGSPNGVQNLKLAQDALSSRQFDIAFAHALEASKDPRLTNWSLLTLGNVKKELGEYGQAFEYYSKIKIDSAPFPDALLATIAIKDKLPKTHGVRDKIKKTSSQLTKTLAQLIKKSSREDLEKYLLLLRADQALELGTYDLAINLYNQIREKYPRTELAKQAKERTERIRKKAKKKNYNFSLAEQLKEANLLMLEKDFQGAQRLIENAVESTKAGSAPRLDAMLAKENLLRKLKKIKEADALLASISLQSSYGSSDQATFLIAQNNWRTNKPEQAVKFADQLLSRFPKSYFKKEALYIKGRALEELGKNTEAINSYNSLIKHSPNSLDQVKANKRIAWINLLNKDFSSAATNFKITKNIAEVLISSPEITETEKYEAKESYLHAMFWQGYALKQLKTTTGEIAEDVWQNLTAKDPFGYYGTLAKYNLGLTPTKNPIFDPESKRKLEELCLLEINEDQQDYLSDLQESGLGFFAEAEISWMYIDGNRNNETAPSELLKQSITKSDLLSKYSNTKYSAVYGLRFLKTHNEQLKNAELFDCANLVKNNAFPSPFLDDYKKYAAENKINLALPLGVSRTESLFEPTANSSSDARGLMQLMMATAVGEGLMKNEDLYNPQTNIRLGTKYLAKLLKTFGNEPQAISAYNAGPTATKTWLERFPNLDDSMWIEMISYGETRDYVKRVLTAKWFYEENLGLAQ